MKVTYSMIKAIIFDWGGVLGEENTKVAARKLAPTYECDRKELESALSKEEAKYSSRCPPEIFRCML